MMNGAESSRFVDLKGVRERRLLLFFVSIALLFAPRAFSQTTIVTDTTLAGIESLYDNGSYISAELQARRMLEQRSLSDSVRIQLEKYVAFSLVAQGQNEEAVDHFRNALAVDSGFTLDPVLTSPKILVVFESARNQFEAERAKETAAVPVNSPSVVSDHPRPGPTFRAILFPGWEQSFEGESVKGHLLLGAGAATALSTIAFYFLQRNARSNYLSASTPDLASSRYKTYNSLHKAEFYSISAFVLVYVYSGIDAFVNLPPNFDADFSASHNEAKLNFRLHF